MSNENFNQQFNDDYSQTDYYQQPVNQADQTASYSLDNQAYYDEYYGGMSMQYNADQIAQYEQHYDDAYANQYYDYYYNYYNNQAPTADDLTRHYQEYQYYLENYDYMKQNFPKKTKIIRWEEIDKHYNSLEQTSQYIEMLEQYQQEQENEQQMQGSY